MKEKTQLPAGEPLDGGEVLPAVLPDTGLALADMKARGMARQVGYQLPGDSTNPDLICRDIAANSRRTVEACLEMGKGLLVLKSMCDHGDFIERVEGIGIDINVAGRFMRAARKFSNSPSTANLLPKIGSQTKLLELLVLDDEKMEELAETGQTGELKLDDVACMGVRELRQAVRKLRTDVAAKDGAIKVKEQRISALEEAGARRGGGNGDGGDDTAVAEDDGSGELLEAEKAVRDAVVSAKSEMIEVLATIAALRRIEEETGAGKEIIDCDEVVYSACRDLIAAARRLAYNAGVVVQFPVGDDGSGGDDGIAPLDTSVPVDNEEVVNEFWRREGVPIDKLKVGPGRGDDDR
jgi:hypothetical protein